jgi:PST family polysaccharide transporter
MLGSSSVITILVSLVASKAWALLLGPGGMGLLGLLQGVIGLAGLIAGLGIGVGMVRMGASALDQGDLERVSAIYRAGWLLTGITGALATAALALGSQTIAALMLGSSGRWPYVLLMSIAVLFTIAAGIQTSMLNAHQRVAALARIAIVNSLLGTSVGLLIIWVWGERGVAATLITTAAVSWGVSRVFLYRATLIPNLRPAWGAVWVAARDLLRFGAPYTASMLVGTGVQFALPALALHQLGADSVGYYRAAMAISVTYLGFLLNAMTQDYYPRIAAASARPDELVRLVNLQHRLVLLLCVPMILGVLALAPYLVPLIYSSAFSPAVEVIEWQLVGDLLKLSSWTMSFVVLARSSGKVLFGTEVVGGMTTLIASWFGVRYFGLAGLGIGFLVTYMVYYPLIWLILRRDIGFRWTGENVRLMTLALGAVLVVRLMPLVAGELVRTAVALTLAAIAGAASLSMIWREFGGFNLARTK